MQALLTASSKSELLSCLAQIDIAVPRRGSGRSHEHKERWVICRLLSSLAHDDVLTYPLKIEQMTPPNADFLVSMSSIQIGVEITEATTEVWSQFLSYAENLEGDVIIEPASFRPTVQLSMCSKEDRMTKMEMESEARKGSLTSAGWSGDTPELEWAHYIEKSVIKKLTLAGKYRLASSCQKLWLAIYENAPLPNIDYHKALDVVRTKLPLSWYSETGFNAIFVESGNNILCIEEDMARVMPVHDLWSGSRAERQVMEKDNGNELR